MNNYSILVSNIPWGHCQIHRHWISCATGLTLPVFYISLRKCFVSGTGIDTNLHLSLYGFKSFHKYIHIHDLW